MHLEDFLLDTADLIGKVLEIFLGGEKFLSIKFTDSMFIVFRVQQCVGIH